MINTCKEFELLPLVYGSHDLWDNFTIKDCTSPTNRGKNTVINLNSCIFSNPTTPREATS